MQNESATAHAIEESNWRAAMVETTTSDPNHNTPSCLSDALAPQVLTEIEAGKY